MINKTKNLFLRPFWQAPKELAQSDVKEARKYIDQFWPHLTRHQSEDADTLIGLPNPYLVPAYNESSAFTFDEMYYWDSYFMVQGMLGDYKNKHLVMGILDNLFFLIKRYGMVPNANKTYLISHSQPPLLTSFIFDVYDAFQLDRRWLEQAIGYAKKEYHTVWMGEKKPHHHQVYKGLSRYYDVNVHHDLAEAESGWDMTTRFGRKCLDYLPVDLNTFLYVYETDFMKAAEILEDQEGASLWRKTAANRKKVINSILWNERRGNFFDFNYKKQSQGAIASLASYTTLWAGLASKSQAKKMVKNLSRFETKGGLTTTEDPTMQLVMPGKLATQWAYPNGWAPLHFFAVYGLKRYGYHKEARRIAQKWLRTNLSWFEEHDVFLEKYNVVSPDKLPADGLYPLQTGFGWTNAIFERFCQDFIDRTDKNR